MSELEITTAALEKAAAAFTEAAKIMQAGAVTQPIGCRPNDMCIHRLDQLEETTQEMRHALYGQNGDKMGLIGTVRLIEERTGRIADSYNELRKYLIGVVISVLLTFIGVVVNLVIR